MPGHLFLTGATGLVGFQVLLDALEEGYRVRVAIRQDSQSSKLLSKPALAEYHSSISFAVISNFTDPSAFVPHLHEITHIIHCASPMPKPSDDYVRDIIDPCRKATLNILDAARENRTVKSVVLTSSISANIVYPPKRGAVIRPNDRMPVPEAPFPPPEAELAYQASKAAALEATDQWVKDEKNSNLNLGVATVFPGYVFGRDEAATNVTELLRGSNLILLQFLRGQVYPWDRLSGAVLLKDLSAVHLAALKEGEKAESSVAKQGNRCFGATVPVVDQGGWNYVQEDFPEAAKRGVFKEGKLGNLGENWDASDTEKVLGVGFSGLKAMVHELGEQYLEMLEREESTTRAKGSNVIR